jgi:TetR/AcrR family transcriptional repressor of nem operon
VPKARSHPKRRPVPPRSTAPLDEHLPPKPERPLAPREFSKQRTREALIEAALACFAEQGIYEPSLDAICERAGCTRGAFYVHFEDREALVVAAMENRRAAVLAALLESSAASVTIAGILEAFAAAVEAGAFPLPGAVRTSELLVACRRSEAIRKTQLRLMVETAERLEERLRADQAAHRLRKDVDPGTLSTLLLLFEAGAELLLDLGYPLDARRVATALVRLLA